MNRNLARLAKDLKKYGVTQEAIAAACDPPVVRTMVNKVVNGKAVSARVVATAVRLIEEAKTREPQSRAS